MVVIKEQLRFIVRSTLGVHLHSNVHYIFFCKKKPLTFIIFFKFTDNGPADETVKKFTVMASPYKLLTLIIYSKLY